MQAIKTTVYTVAQFATTVCGGEGITVTPGRAICQNTMAKRLSHTHAERHAAWSNDGALRNSDCAPSDAFKALCGELIGVDTDAMKFDRQWHKGTANNEGKRNLDGSYSRTGTADLGVYSLSGVIGCDMDTTDDITPSEPRLVESVIDGNEELQSAVLNQDNGLKAAPVKQGRGRPRKVSADDSLSPDARKELNEMENRFDRAN